MEFRNLKLKKKSCGLMEERNIVNILKIANHRAKGSEIRAQRD